MTIEEIDKYCELCMDVNCTGCEFQDVNFRDVSYYKPTMTKDEALKVSANMLNKLYHSDNVDSNAINLQALLLTAEADKDYSKMFHILEELRKFIIKLQESLKQKE